MRYFTYLAEQSFKSDAEGRRVFCLGGPFSRPFIVLDAATESRLFNKLTWCYRIFLSVLIVGPILLLPCIFHQPTRFIAFLGAVVAVQWLALKLVFFADLRKLTPDRSRISLRVYYAEMARRHSRRELVFGLVGSLAFATTGAAMLFAGGIIAIDSTIIVLFGVCAAAWGYALRLKLAEPSDQEI
jgi:hypothetical protein